MRVFVRSRIVPPNAKRRCGQIEQTDIQTKAASDTYAETRLISFYACSKTQFICDKPPISDPKDVIRRADNYDCYWSITWTKLDELDLPGQSDAILHQRQRANNAQTNAAFFQGQRNAKISCR